MEVELMAPYSEADMFLKTYCVVTKVGDKTEVNLSPQGLDIFATLKVIEPNMSNILRIHMMSDGSGIVFLRNNKKKMHTVKYVCDLLLIDTYGSVDPNTDNIRFAAKIN